MKSHAWEECIELLYIVYEWTLKKNQIRQLVIIITGSFPIYIRPLQESAIWLVSILM